MTKNTDAALNGSLCFLSAAALLTQTLAIREVLALTGGNEIIIAVVFAVWFFWSGIGAAVAGWWRLSERLRPGILCFASTLGAGWLPLVQVFMTRLGARWLETDDGRLTDLWHAGGGTALLLAPAPFLSGALFAAMAAVQQSSWIAAAAIREDCGTPAERAPRGPSCGVSAVLAGDYAGATVGALTAGTLLVPYLGAAGTLLLTSLCLALGLLLFRSPKLSAIHSARGSA